jgi:hypothetical protein
LLLSSTLFVRASVVTARAPPSSLFIVSYALQGLYMSLMLIAAAPTAGERLAHPD